MKSGNISAVCISKKKCRRKVIKRSLFVYISELGFCFSSNLIYFQTMTSRVELEYTEIAKNCLETLKAFHGLMIYISTQNETDYSKDFLDLLKGNIK